MSARPLASPPILELRSISKAFGALVVADGISLEVHAGEIHALIGPNGAGKTTLVHQISGALAPDSGQIILNGAAVTGLPAHSRAKRGLARSFQITSIIPSLTVRGNVALAAQAQASHATSMLRTAARDTELNAIADEALASVGLIDHADAPSATLAHGQKRALEVAMALASRPKLILLDEPLAGMGREESRAMIALIASLVNGADSAAILLIEHDMEAVFRLATRVSVLVAGRIIASGTPDEMRADPAVKAAYLGEGSAGGMA
ncbi:MAG: ABC transporter ATP-binding protein [Bosea sp. (in: a-proteobacteria)]